VQKKIDRKFYRIIDANFNRAKEGLRVCEDISRFFYNKKNVTRKYKNARHELTEAIACLGLEKIIQARDIQGDIGKKSSPSEFYRAKTKDVFYANAQRVKESLRVLEEVTKLIDMKVAQDVKALRYKVYALEKNVISMTKDFT